MVRAFKNRTHKVQFCNVYRFRVSDFWMVTVSENNFTPFSVPGVSQFVPMETPNDSPANQANVIQGLSQEDLATIHRKLFFLSKVPSSNNILDSELLASEYRTCTSP